MYIERKQDLSVYYFIQQAFEDAGGTFVNIVDDFPTSELELPCISIENHTFTVEPLELGNRKGVDVRTWFINIYTENKSQRDDFAYLIKNKVQEGIPVYDYDLGFPPTVVPQLGSMSHIELSVMPIPVNSALVSTLYFRAQVKVVAVYTKFPAT